MKKIFSRMGAVLIFSLCVGVAHADDNGVTQAMQDQGCDPNVAQMISKVQQANISGNTEMAHKLYDYINQISNQVEGCLQSLLPSAIFQKPGVGDLWNTIGNQVCNRINQVADPTLSTINNGIGQVQGTIDNTLYHNISLGVGGVNLGTVPMGYQATSTGSLFQNGAFSKLYNSVTTNKYDSIGSYINTGNLMQIDGKSVVDKASGYLQ